MPKKRAPGGYVRDGMKSGGRFLPNKTSDIPEPDETSLNQMGLVNVVLDDTDVVTDWDTVSARIGENKIQWTKQPDGSVTSNCKDKMTFMMLERLHDENYWNDYGAKWATRENRDDVAVWGSEIVGDMLENGWVDPEKQSTDISSSAQTCMTACYTHATITPQRMGRHRLSVGMARSKASQFLQTMDAQLRAQKLGGYRSTRDLDSQRKQTLTFVEANYKDCFMSYDFQNHRVKGFNGTDNDLIWKLMLEEVPRDAPVDHEIARNYQQTETKLASALQYALSHPDRVTDLFTTSEQLHVSRRQDAVRLIIDGCIENDDIAAEVIRWINPENLGTGTRDYEPTERYTGSRFSHTLLEMLTEHRDSHYRGDRLRRAIQIAAAGHLISYNGTSWEDSANVRTYITNAFKEEEPPQDEEEKHAREYAKIEAIHGFRQLLETWAYPARLLNEAKANGWEQDKYTAEAIRKHETIMQSIYKQAPPELHKYIPNAHLSDDDLINEDKEMMYLNYAAKTGTLLPCNVHFHSPNVKAKYRADRTADAQTE